MNLGIYSPQHIGTIDQREGVVTALACVAEAVPGHVMAVATVVAGVAPPAALIIVLPIIGRMYASAANVVAVRR
jgi:hypothetical protein